MIHSPKERPLAHLLFISYLGLSMVLLITSFLPFWAEVLAAAFATLSLTNFVTQKISSPLARLQKIAENLAKGDFKNQFPWSESEEISLLVAAFSEMAIQLEDRFTTITTQKNEKEAILASMNDGVITIDRNEKILDANTAASKILGIPILKLQGLTLFEAYRNSELEKFVHTLLTEDEPQHDIIISDPQFQSFQVQGVPLKNPKNQIIGALIVFHDLTPIKQLDAIRKDFVANVSHELKTPITLIKGSLETLEDPTLDTTEHQHFLKMAQDHANRLDHILEDLLSIARLEQSNQSISTQQVILKEIITKSLHFCEPLLKEHSIHAEIVGDQNITLACNGPLLEQALINLIKNAVLYSGTSTIKIEIHSAESIQIDVTDYGCGIDATHLSRLFERFYRIDKARTRKEGGTGLGLALVKHIVQAHFGHVEVHSEVGKGSTFSIILPKT